MKNTVLAQGDRKSCPAAHMRYKHDAARSHGFFSPRLMLVVFALGFLFFCVFMTWAVSGGQPLFGAQIAGVDENDLFFKMFLADEARANLAGPQGGPEPATLKLFSYTVNKDDSLSRIAEKTGVNLDALISLNKLSDAHVITIGQQLTIPNQKGIYYKVKKGDTIGKLVKDYKIAGTAIQEANGLARDELETGSVIFLPGARLSAEEMDKALGMDFVRPARGGWISSVPGYRRDPFTLGHQFHPGIDIALPYGTAIVAARSGQVEFAGWNGGYGRMVMVKHTDGYSSIYGHMQRFIVSGGQWVRAGQVIGYVGSTGYSTGPHLHFELRRYGQFVNPMSVPGFRRAFSR
ncbi:MAG: M23 family metallopeptidase [Spirochaetota bacterium]|jgi:murein DD-endopeptidase MepM/ murein hydrolase activator NlpD|nr:M23 family metallopeptidase [Spirochaetota bacterium]